MTDPRAVLVIVDGSVAVTGALVSAARQAELLKDQLSIVLVLPANHKIPPSRLAAFAEVVELPIAPLRKNLASLLRYLPSLVFGSIRLRRHLTRFKTERVQINDFYLMHGTVLRMLGFRGRIVTFVRIDPTRFGLAGRIWLAAARWSSNDIAVVSRFIQGLVGTTIPSQLVYEHIPKTVSSPRKPNGQLLVIVGNFIEGKGQDHAVEAFNHIAMLFPNAHLRLIGGDMGMQKNRNFRSKVERLAADGPAADRIEFRGESDDLTADYAQAVAALNFSASESFSITCLDASAAGLPVIATRCGGPEEIIEEGVTGWLVPIGDVAAMAEKMRWILKHPAKARAMGLAGRALVVERFSAERARAQLRALFCLQEAAGDC